MHKCVTSTLFAFAFSACSESPPPLTEPAYRAMTRLEAATSMAVAKTTFDDLIRELRAELLILRDLAQTAEDSAVHDSYASALEKYMDASYLWRDMVDFSKFDWIPRGRIYLIHNLFSDKYNLPRRQHKSPLDGSTYETVPEESIQKIWSLAKTDADSGSALVVKRLRARK
jgi:hypothetical protein